MSYSGYICLRISGEGIDFQNISDTLSVHATEIQKTGEDTNSKYGINKYKMDSWIYEVKYDEITNISKIIFEFLERFNDNGESIKKIKELSNIVLWCDLYSDYFQMGFTIEPQLMKRLAELRIQLDVQIYLHGMMQLSRKLT